MRTSKRGNPRRNSAFYGRAFLVFSLSLALALAATSALAKTSSHPTIKVTPKKVAINRKATIVGSHLWPNTNVTLVLAVPDLVKGAAESFVGGIQRVDGKGHLKVTVKMPVLTKCGRATLYASPFGQPKGSFARTHITVTGCSASSKGVKPAPPPTAK